MVDGRTLCVKLEALTTVPLVKAPSVMLAPDAPAVTSMMTVVPSLLKRRAKVGVMLATAVPAVIALAVSKPLTAAGKAVALSVSVTPSVLVASAVSAVAG